MVHCRETKLVVSHLGSHVCLEYEMLLHMSKTATRNESVTLLTELGFQNLYKVPKPFQNLYKVLSQRNAIAPRKPNTHSIYTKKDGNSI